MLLLVALLALLSLCVSGLPTSNTTGFNGGNTTDVNVLFNEHPRCWWGGTDMKEQPGECRCFHDGAGVHRNYMIDAINKACLAWSGGLGEPTAVYGLGPGLNQGTSVVFLMVTLSRPDTDSSQGGPRTTTTRRRRCQVCSASPPPCKFSITTSAWALFRSRASTAGTACALSSTRAIPKACSARREDIRSGKRRH